MDRARQLPHPLVILLPLLSLCACASREVQLTDYQVMGEWPPSEGVIALRGCEATVADTHVHCFLGTMVYSDWQPSGDRRQYPGVEGSHEEYTHCVLLKHPDTPEPACKTSFFARSESPDRGLASWEIRVGDEAVVVRYMVTREPPLDFVDVGGKGYDLAAGRLFLIDFTTDPPEILQRDSEALWVVSLMTTPVVGAAAEPEGPTPFRTMDRAENLRSAIEYLRDNDPDVEDLLE